MAVIALLVTGAVAACAVAAGFGVVVAGIRAGDRRAGRPGEPCCRADALARWVLNARLGEHVAVAPRAAGPGAAGRAGQCARPAGSPSRPGRPAAGCPRTGELS